MSGKKRTPEEQRLLAVMAEVRSRLRELLLKGPSISTELLAPVCSTLTHALKNRQYRSSRPEPEREPEEKLVRRTVQRK